MMGERKDLFAKPRANLVLAHGWVGMGRVKGRGREVGSGRRDILSEARLMHSSSLTFFYRSLEQLYRLIGIDGVFNLFDNSLSGQMCFCVFHAGAF